MISVTGVLWYLKNGHLSNIQIVFIKSNHIQQKANWSCKRSMICLYREVIGPMLEISGLLQEHVMPFLMLSQRAIKTKHFEISPQKPKNMLLILLKVYMYIYVCACVVVYVYVYVYMYVYVYVMCMCMCICICICKCICTVKPVYNDHRMGYFSAFWSSSRWPMAT